MRNPLRYLLTLATDQKLRPTPGVKRRPTGAALRNPADPAQAARIEAAAAKLESKAYLLSRNMTLSSRNQPFHLAGKFCPFSVTH